MKAFFAIAATTLLVIAYIPYITNILRNNTRPHPYSWFISGSLTFIAFLIQLTHGGGVGVIPTFIGSMAGLLVFALSLSNSHRPQITKSDTLFLLAAIIAACVWLIAKQPLASVILLSVIDVLAFVPTVRKSWKHPEQETALYYYLDAARFTFAVLALQHYSAVTVLYPACTVIADCLHGTYILIRRKMLRQPIISKALHQ